MKKQPQQTAQTRKKLMDSFWKLYCDDGIDRVTVGAVAKDAGYNRGTFYEYFTDVYDLLDQLEDELLGELERNAAAIVGAGCRAACTSSRCGARSCSPRTTRRCSCCWATRATHGSS